MAARFATVTEEKNRQINKEATPANTKATCLVNTKTTIPSMPVPSDLDIYLTDTRFGKYQSLAYTKPVNSVFRALWLVSYLGIS